jgi:hypothetical protein
MDKEYYRVTLDRLLEAGVDIRLYPDATKEEVR